MAVAVLLVFVAAAVGLTIWLVSRWYDKRNAAWTGAAQATGLQRLAATNLRGERYGQYVHARTVQRGSGDSKSTYTVISASMHTPMDLGLNIRRHGFVNNLFHRSEDVIVGDASFDDAFLVSGDEPHRVQALLQPKLRHTLTTQLARGDTFDLGDSGLTIECRGTATDQQWLTGTIELCARVTAKMDKSRRNVPCCSWLAQHRNAWNSFAAAHGLYGMDTPLCVWGNIGSVAIRAFAVRVARGKYELEINVQFAQQLGIGLEVRPPGLLDKMAVFIGMQDHKVGDHLFDETFRVQVAAPHLLDQVLDAQARGMVLTIQRDVGPVTLNDSGMSVRLPHVPHEPAVVPRTVQKIVGVAELLASRSRLDGGVGAYR